jgi:hypothetical protein
MFRRWYIKFKIWNLKRELESLSSDVDFYWINLAARNIRYYEKKLDLESLYKDFVKQQKKRRIDIKEKIEILQKILENQ